MGDDDGGFYALIVLAIILGAVAIGASPKGCATSQQSPDQTDLIVLPSPPFDIHSTATSDLLDPGYWAMVRASAANTTAYLVHDTVVGFNEEYQGWGNWTLGHIPDAPRWAGTGFTPYADSELYVLQDQALSSGNATRAAGALEYQASKVVGLSLATADYVSLNSVSALRTYFETGSVIRAVCATYPAQLGQLWREAFDPGLPREQRANLLGRALAVTAFVVAMAGADGFSPKLKVALDKVGLADSWGTVKPYLGKIGSVISDRASYLTFSLLQKLAARFPGISPSEAGFLTARLEAMSEVYHTKGVTNDLVEQKIGGLVQTAGDASNPDDIATSADVATYRDEGAFQVEINTKRQMLLYFDDTGTSREIPSNYLQNFIPGFNPDQAASIAVHYQELGVTVYHYYTGRYDNWVPKVPEDFAVPGDVLTISVEILTKDGFVKSIPQMTMTNDAGISWLTEEADATFSLAGTDLTIQVSQIPSIEGASSFTINGKVSDALGFNAGITYLDFQVTDVFGVRRDMRVSYNGYGTPRLAVFSDPDYSPTFLVSSDGVRLKFASDTGGGETEVATIYVQEPSGLYILGKISDYNNPNIQVIGASKLFEIDSVNMPRQLERDMLYAPSKYTHGRIGAEIAYTVGKDEFGLKNIIMEEMSKGGRDLYTQDNKIAIQARMLTDRNALSPSNIDTTIQNQLNDLIDKLNKDFGYHRGVTTTGYAILSYLDPTTSTIKTIVAEVDAPVTSP